MHSLIILLHILDPVEAVLCLCLALVWLPLSAYETRTTTSTSTTPLEFRVVITSPEDGDLKPERGERKDKRMKVVKGRLAPPEKASKAKKDSDRRRRGARKQKALAQK